MEDIRQKIAIEIYNSNWLSNECRKICSKDTELQDDLFQEILLIILEFKEDGALQRAYKRNEHLAFIKKIIMNQFNSVTSPFYKNFRKFAAITKTELIDDTNEDYGDKEGN
jgi:hypothetical protein